MSASSTLNRLAPAPAPCTCEADSPILPPRTVSPMPTPIAPPATSRTSPAPTTNDTLRRLRQTILSAARLIVARGGAEPVGEVAVTIEVPAECTKLHLEPARDSTGRDTDADELSTADAALAAQVRRLTKHLLSPDEMKLMRDLLAHQPCSATSVMERCKAVVSKTDFWAIWGQLQMRELVEQGDDEKYRVGAEWLMGMLTEG